jgi:hypothetical protein
MASPIAAVHEEARRLPLTRGGAGLDKATALYTSLRPTALPIALSLLSVAILALGCVEDVAARRKPR